MPTWTTLELLRWTTGYLGEKGLPEARLNAELLLADTLGVKRLDLYLQFDRPMRPEELAAFKARLLRRARREPLQYIAGEAAFRHLVLRVDRRVLIPRPETELLVERVLEWGRDRAGLAALDVGTGSGAIALSLASEGAAFGRVVATDLSADALDVARGNARGVLLSAELEFRQGVGLAPVAGERFDVIVSNPPYIGDEERASLDPEVRDWEPPVALFAGADGLVVIRDLVGHAADHLHPRGLLALEIGAEQADAVAGLIRGTGRFGEPRVHEDYAGRDRIVMAELA